ncbi:MAG: glycosyltransferase family 2 protein, partial [Synergistaceae bacterium]|nr:glycosyltransferase family 2 protein [Synergistaceae bacterium]
MDTLNLYNGSRLTAHGELAHSQKLLSVIIPAYNTAKFLNKCVESVVNQTYKNIEIIIVDDGSSDSTSQICDELASKYKNIKVIHQENKGLAQTRGVGFNASRGDYIAFVDSDDYIDLNAYETAIKVLEDNEADMVMFGCYVIEPDGNILQEFKWPEIVINKPENIFAYFAKTKDPTWSMWSKVYKRGIFEDIEWPKINMSEDYFISAQLFAKAQKFASMDKIFYYYVQQPDSLCHQPYTNSVKRSDIIQAHNSVIKLTSNKFPEFLPEILWRRVESIYNILINYISQGYNGWREVTEQLLPILKQD